MKQHSIIKGQLFTDLDTPYCEEGNKIDVYSSVYWTVDTEDQTIEEAEKEYEAAEKLINDFKVETELFEMFAWCDISGFQYWVVQQEEENYVSIDVVLKKPVEDYTQEEMIIIREAIIKADDYFQTELL